jgi:hypothetical protein
MTTWIGSFDGFQKSLHVSDLAEIWVVSIFFHSMGDQRTVEQEDCK